MPLRIPLVVPRDAGCAGHLVEVLHGSGGGLCIFHTSEGSEGQNNARETEKLCKEEEHPCTFRRT